MSKATKVVMALVISASVSFSSVALADRNDGPKHHRSGHAVKMHHAPKFNAPKHHAPKHTVVHHVHRAPPPPKHKVVHHVHHTPPPPHHHDHDNKSLNMALVGLTAAIIYNTIN